MKAHPAAEVFPMLDEKELRKLADDIKANGQQVPIEVYRGKILDGRNRLAACKLAGVKPQTVEVDPPDPVVHVVSRNLFRRHLTVSQRAMIAAKIATLRPGRKPSKAPMGAVDVAAAAAGLNVGKRSVTRAKKVLSEASPEVVESVTRGKMTLRTAEKVATLPKPDQRKAVTEEPRAARQAVEKAKTAHADASDTARMDFEGLCQEIGLRYRNGRLSRRDLESIITFVTELQKVKPINKHPSDAGGPSDKQMLVNHHNRLRLDDLLKAVAAESAPVSAEDQMSAADDVLLMPHNKPWMMKVKP